MGGRGGLTDGPDRRHTLRAGGEGPLRLGGARWLLPGTCKELSGERGWGGVQGEEWGVWLQRWSSARSDRALSAKLRGLVFSKEGV